MPMHVSQQVLYTTVHQYCSIPHFHWIVLASNANVYAMSIV